MAREVRQAQGGEAALADAEHLAGAAQPQVLLGDAKAVVGRAQDLETRARRGRERLVIEEQASRCSGAPADPPAELVQLRETEALGVLDHHHAGR